ncbi:MAG: GIY-YIG nuclease family protein [Candidatus Gastranaerophilales bacterium]|nr:GIY-YIG nuclease family protein [Candidatus Gastranaerophilales bacterium]
MGEVCNILHESGIYSIECLINGKKYIGQSIDMKKRVIQHRCDLRRHDHMNEDLQSDWDEYGEGNFSFDVLEKCEISELDNKERFYIGCCKSNLIEFGYNIEAGGICPGPMCDRTKEKQSKVQTGKVRTDETRKRLSESHLGEKNSMYGKHHTDETKKKISENRRPVRGKDYPNYGKHFSEETRAKLSASHIGKNTGASHPRHHSIYCPELDEYFDTITAATRKYGVSDAHISSCLSGTRKSAGKHPITGEKLHWLDAKTGTNNLQQLEN